MKSPNDGNIIVLLHEICHALIDGSEREVFFTDKNTTTTDKNTIGVRDSIFRGHQNVSSVADMTNRDLYLL